ncbi:hypothetical protein FRC08_005914 [Ceratobasidium sp. 394]|nr:hypothetical protein FRC08_005914 [Ceratobasidium sp. 394]
MLLPTPKNDIDVVLYLLAAICGIIIYVDLVRLLVKDPSLAPTIRAIRATRAYLDTTANLKAAAILEANCKNPPRFRRGPLQLPVDLIYTVADILTSPSAGARPVTLDDTSDHPRVSPKPNFDLVRGMSCACRKMREIVFIMWFRTLYVREPEDWDAVVRMNICVYVLEVRVLANALDMRRKFPNTILARFPLLHTVFIDAHNDFIHVSVLQNNPRLSGFLAAHPGKSGFSQLPRLVWPDTLRRIWITNTHFGNIIVPQVIKMCPDLEELCISRCTVFSKNVAGPKRLCAFWDGDMKQHEDYFLVKGANSPWDQLLKTPLSKLRKLELGTYNIPGVPFITHCTKHKEIILTLNPTGAYDTAWNEFCPKCVREFGPGELMAGAIISQALAIKMPCLEEIAWPLFCSAGRVTSVVWTPDNVFRLPKYVLEELPLLKGVSGGRTPKLFAL